MAPKPKALDIIGYLDILLDYFGKRSYPRECGAKGFYQI